MKARNQKGQVFVIVLMVTVIALTVVLSVASRNIVTLRTAREERDSQRALSAAEAGIERSLKTGDPFPTPQVLETDLKYTTEVNPASTPIEGTQLLVNGDNVVSKDEGADVWLVAHDANNDPVFSAPWSGDLTIYWGDDALGACNNAALEIVVISGTVSSPVLARYAFDPCSTRRNNNNFGSPGSGGTVSGKTFAYSEDISVTSGFLVKVVPLYASTTLGISATVALPSQGRYVEATGQSGDLSRKIGVFRGYPSLPVQYFLYGLFSP